MTIKAEGSVRFWLQHQQKDWATDDGTYHFGITQQAEIALKATKHSDKTIAISINGPLGQNLQFRRPIPKCDSRGLHVVVTWKYPEIKLYLNGHLVEITFVVAGYRTGGETEALRQIGKCVYCGVVTESLSDEHIVPYGLNGPWVLGKASCAACAEKTSKFETDILRHHLIASRTTLGLRTYHPKKRPRNFTVYLDKDGRRQNKEVAVGEYPALIVMPVFPRPTYLEGQPYIGNHVTGYQCIQVGGKAGDDLRKELGSDFLTVEVAYKPYSFCQMLAKIAYCIAVGQFGLEAIEESYILPIIKGESDETERWIGTADSVLLPAEKELHTLALDVSLKDNEIVCRIRLFSVFNAPEYLVVVGRMKEGALAS